MTTEAPSLNNYSLAYREDAGDWDSVVWEIVDVASPIIIFAGLAGNALGAASLLRVAGPIVLYTEADARCDNLATVGVGRVDSTCDGRRAVTKFF